MEWLLLYPLIGLGLGIYYAFKYHKYGQPEATGFMVCVMAGFWPFGWYYCAKDVRRFAAEAAEKKELVHEALLERVRAEARATHRRQIAEFDKELGIEPAWKKAHPSAAMEWENIYEDWVRRRGLPNYSKGGRL